MKKKILLIIVVFQLICEAINKFSTAKVISGGNVTNLGSLIINCTINGNTGALLWFQYYDDGNNAYYDYDCNFFNQTTKNIITVFTSYGNATTSPVNNYNLVGQHNIDCTSIGNYAINTFYLDYSQINNKFRYVFICVQINALNPTISSWQTNSFVSNASPCNYGSLNYFKNLIGPNFGSTDTNSLLIQTKLYDSSVNCNSYYVYKTRIICDISCSGCSNTATNCNSCATGYYSLLNSSSVCYSTPPSGYYLSILQQKYCPCNSNCDSCNSTVINGNEKINCFKCLSGFLMVEGLGNCVNLVPQGYFLDTIKNMYSLCYNSCNTCSTAGTVNSMNCLTCASGNYPLNDKPSQCFSSSNISSNYVLNNNIFYKCYVSCGTCSSVGNSIDNKCNTCATNYYTLNGNPSQCYLNSNSTPGYFFNNGTFSQCYFTCYQCLGFGNVNNNNCKSCAPNYYPLSNNLTQCYSNSTIPNNYYLYNNKFYKCYDSCGSCSNIGNVSNHSCLTCMNGYYSLQNNSNMCFKNAPQSYYFDSNDSVFKSCFSNCASCSFSGNETKNNCNTCLQNFVFYQNSCLVACPNRYIIDSTNNCILSNCSNGNSTGNCMQTLSIYNLRLDDTMKEILQNVQNISNDNIISLNTALEAGYTNGSHLMDKNILINIFSIVSKI